MLPGKTHPVATVLVADADEALTQALRNELGKEREGLRLIGVARSGAEAVRACQRRRPDLLLLDLILPGLDGLAVLQALRRRALLDRVKVVIHTALRDEEIVAHCLNEFQVAYFSVKPLQLPLLVSRLREVAAGVWPGGRDLVRGAQQVEQAATRHLDSLGIPSHYKGYRYLKEAIRLTVVSPELLSPITGRLYRLIAQRYATSPNGVERSIRHAIETACTRGNLEVINALFSHSIDQNRGKPSNSLFIARLADKIRLEAGRKGGWRSR